MRLCFLVGSLDGGGIARVVSTMANYWDERDREISILTFDGRGVRPLYPLNHDVRVERLDLLSDSTGKLRAVVSNVVRIQRIRAALQAEKPDAVMAFGATTNVLGLLATRGLNCSVLVSERVDPVAEPIGRFWNAARGLTYRWATHIVLQTEAMRARSPAGWQARSVTIPNPVPALDAPAPAARPRARPRVVAMGRLAYQKGFDLLLDAFARIHPQHPDWELVVWGEGPERTALEAQTTRLGLAAAVCFPGATDRAFEELAAADLFIMPSRYEGFPNALCEAMSAGLPVIATDCPSGPAEIVRDGIDGLLVESEDVDALADALDSLFADAGMRTRLGGAARSVVERFSVSEVMSQWEALLPYFEHRAG
ncbi:MAG: glycosyltransferase family 4 protein [Pseudomonadota bacterium]